MTGRADISLLFDLFVTTQRIRRVLSDAMSESGMRPDEYAVYSLLFDQQGQVLSYGENGQPGNVSDPVIVGFRGVGGRSRGSLAVAVASMRSATAIRRLLRTEFRGNSGYRQRLYGRRSEARPN